MDRVLILFAHPALEKSRVQKRLAKKASAIKGITFHDLYEAYPDFDIDVKVEQELLLRHDIFIFQHPFYWYSAPAIIKQWLDLVLEHGWAYGNKGDKLTGKYLMNAISTGGPEEAYGHQGYNHFTLRELLTPFEQTARRCNMNYLPPFAITGTLKLNPGDIDPFVTQYEQILTALRDDDLLDRNEWQSAEYMNKLFPLPQTV